MTTRVTVDAHAGWPVHVTRIDPKTGDELGTDTVEPNQVRDFYVHDGLLLKVAEGARPKAAA